MTKDIKYIIKRVIIGVLISIILMYIGSLKVKAQEIIQSQYWTGGNGSFYPSSSNRTINIGGLRLLENYGKGFIIFNMFYSPNTLNSATNITIIDVQVISSKGNLFTCELGNYSNYWDNNKTQTVLTPKCYINTTNDYIQGFIFKTNYIDGQQGISYTIGTLVTFVSAFSDNDSSSSSIATAIQQQTQQQAQQAQQAHQDAQNIQNSITSEESPSTSDVTGNTDYWASNNANNGVINQLVQMPITLLNAVVNGLSSSCSPYNLGSLFGTDLILPCVNMSNILGSLWTLIDVIISGIFIFIFGGRCVKIFNDFTNLKGGQVDQLYGGGN